jgi:hypothetical protein
MPSHLGFMPGTFDPTGVFMSSPATASIRSRAQTIASLAGLLEHVEHSAQAPDPGQYRGLVAQLQAALAEPLPDDVLDAVLIGRPAAATVYENLHYARSGLSRSPLDRSVASEQAATQLLARVSAWPAPTGQA